MAWSPDSKALVSGGSGSLILWDIEAGQEHQKFEIGTQVSFSNVVWSPDGKKLASGSDDKIIWSWDVKTERMLLPFIGHSGIIRSLGWSPNGDMIASGSDDGTVLLWNIETMRYLSVCSGHTDTASCLIWSADGEILISGSFDRTVRLWETRTGQKKGTLEGHVAPIVSVSFLPALSESPFLASKSDDGTIRLWRADTLEVKAEFDEPFPHEQYANMAFHPTLPIMATLGEEATTIHIWDINFERLLSTHATSTSVYYTNAKVVLVGNSGVGKSSLHAALTSRRSVSVASTGKREQGKRGHNVRTFDKGVIRRDDGFRETHETLLWDLARPSYGLIHQFYLQEVAVALVVFDARDETNPLAAVYHWDRVLRLVHGKGKTVLPMKKLLVEARVDRGGSGVSSKRIKELVEELDLDGPYKTSTSERQGITELAEAIRRAINWDVLPKVSSTAFFQEIRDFLLERKRVGKILATEDELYDIFRSQRLRRRINENEDQDAQKAQFETCIGRVESQGLIRRLSFVNYVLLQPELLDDYTSTLLDAVRSEPDGLGSISKKRVESGDFLSVPMNLVRIKDRGLERLLLSAMVEDLLHYEIALLETTDDGEHLVFPSQSTAENPDLPHPEEKVATFHFEGLVTNVYSSLAVRLAHSDVFKMQNLWKNAITYTSRSGEVCGISLDKADNGHGKLIVFFHKDVVPQTRIDFEGYVHRYLQRRTLLTKVEYVLFCPKCGSQFSEQQVIGRHELRKTTISCSACDTEIPLPDEGEQFLSNYLTTTQQKMERAADNQRDLQVIGVRLQVRRENDDFDVFFCYNDEDKHEVEKISEKLEGQEILPFLEERDLKPGQPKQEQIMQYIEKIKRIAIFIGRDEVGPWPKLYLATYLQQFVTRGGAVIPVILSYAPEKPQLPQFLDLMKVVDFHKWELDPINQLIYGITGKRSRH